MARFDRDWNASQSRRRSRRARLRGLVIVLIVYAIILGGLFLVFRSPLLRVKAVNVEGASYTNPDDIINALKAQQPGLIGGMAGWRRMLAWPTELNASTRALIPSIETIRIHKSYIARTITVEVTERRSFGIWCFSRNEPPTCLWFDVKGVAYDPASYTEGSLIPVVRDTAQDRVGDDRKVLPSDLLPNFLAVLTLIHQQHIPARSINIADLGKQEISVPTYQGPTLRFSLRFPPTNVLPVIQDLKQKGVYGGLQYIDFRSENRAFYQ